MKWPELLWLIRHDVSEYNVLAQQKKASPLYKRFLREFEIDPTSAAARALAEEVKSNFSLGTGDAKTNLVDPSARRAEEVGRALATKYPRKPPNVIFVSPYQRTWLTLEGLMRGWKELRDVKVVEEERLREQEHGLALVYNDWRVMHVLHPEQRLLYQMEGPYWYRYPQGESVPDVRERNRSWMTTVVRDFAEKRILAMTHHLNILAVRANLERWDAGKFCEVDRKDKPINCGVTLYRGMPKLGRDGRFVLQYYNRRFY